MPPMTDERSNIGDMARGIALTTLLIAFCLSIPLMGHFGTLFIPLPILYYRVKLGRNPGAVITVSTAAIIAVMAGDAPVTVLSFYKLILLGFVMGEALLMDMSVERTLGYPVAFVVGVLFFGGIVYTVFSGVSLTAHMTTSMGLLLDRFVVLLKEIGMAPENIRYIQTNRDGIIYVIVRVMPAQILVSTLIEAWITLLVARSLFLKRGIHFPDFGKLNHWKAPDYFVWGPIISGFMLLLGDRFLLSIGISGLFFFMAIYFFQGIAIVSFFFEKKKFPPRLKFFLYSLIVLQQLIIIFVAGIGFSDMWLNFRKLEIKKS